MCMTSKQHPVSGYAKPSPLPYTEEALPMPPCQLASFFCDVQSAASPSSMPAAVALSPPVTTPLSSRTPTDTGSLSEQVHARLQSGKRRSQSSPHDLPLPLRKRQCQNPNQRFAAFVAILLLHLDGGDVVTSKQGGGTRSCTKKNFKLTLQAKALVAECCRRNQMGDKNFSPLQESLSERLRGLVGEHHWKRAIYYLQIYLARHHAFSLREHALEEDRQLLHYQC